MKKVSHIIFIIVLCIFLLSACPSAHDTGGIVPGITQGTLSEEYPGDVGMENDPSVVCMVNFENDEISDFFSTYESHSNEDGMQFSSDTPTASSGSQSIAMTSGGNGEDAQSGCFRTYAGRG